MDEIVALCKRRGFVYPTSEIYGGLANSYDYGPLGTEMLRNIRAAWWRTFITRRPDMVGIDTQIIQHPQTWVASGHVGAFSDPLVEDLKTKKRYRADHIIEASLEKEAIKSQNSLINVEEMTVAQMGKFIKDNYIKSPEGNELSEVREFNLLFESAIGTVAGEKSTVYLRGETAQGIFANFKQVVDTTRVKLPFGIGNIGRSFRNEITTGQFIFRTLEFEQAEIEYFFDPEESDWNMLMQNWKDCMWEFVTKTLGVREENLRWRKHTDTERSHYSLDTYDLEYKFPFGWKELWGLAYRTNYDLGAHMKHSGKSLEYVNPQTGKKIIPHVIEPAVGLGRIFFMILADSLWQDSERNRTVLKLSPNIAPYKAAVIPLVRNKPEIVTLAKKVFENLLEGDVSVTWDDRGNIGKCYLYQDEIGTPFCIVIDHESLESGDVTVRNRDTTTQERVKIGNLSTYLSGTIGRIIN